MCVCEERECVYVKQITRESERERVCVCVGVGVCVGVSLL